MTLIAEQGRWVLVDEDDGEVGRYASQDDAVMAAVDYALALGEETPHLLIQSDDGDWDELSIPAPQLH